MPLKPIFGKSPLTTVKNCPLRPGRVHTENHIAEALYRLTAKETADHTELLEPAFRLACIVKDHPENEPCCLAIRALAASQEELGAFPGEPADEVVAASAIWALYEWCTDSALLTGLMRWCAHVEMDWDRFADSTALRCNPADWMALCINLYRVSGKAAVLNICRKIRSVAMDWSGLLATFNATKPASRMYSAQELQNGVQEENWDESGVYTRQYLKYHAESLADGARTTGWTSVYSGSGRDADALRSGWEKLERFHGAACGGLTADALLGGGDPSCAVGSAAVGAWLEAFSVQLSLRDSAWAAEAMERILANALPVILAGDDAAPVQHMNILKKESNKPQGYLYSEKDLDHAHVLGRLARGFAAAQSAAFENSANGSVIQLYMPGDYRAALENGTACFAVETDPGEVRIRVHSAQNAKGTLRMRISSWMKEPVLTINGKEAETEAHGSYLSVSRVWLDGEEIRLTYTPAMQTCEGYHHSIVVYYGAELMAVTAQPWSVAATGAPVLRDGKICLPVATIGGWKEKNGVPQGIPVEPKADGEPYEAEMVPYASAADRLAQLPQCRA